MPDNTYEISQDAARAVLAEMAARQLLQHLREGVGHVTALLTALEMRLAAMGEDGPAHPNSLMGQAAAWRDAQKALFHATEGRRDD